MAKQKKVTKAELIELFADEDCLVGGVPAVVKNCLYGNDAEELKCLREEGAKLFTFADGFFYHGDRTAEGFAERVRKSLDTFGLVGRVHFCGDHFYHGFEGGAKTICAKSSFFFAVVSITRK